MHIIIHLRKFYRPACFPRSWKLIHVKLLYYRLYCMAVKLGLSLWERSTGYGCSRIKYLGRYLRLRKTKLQAKWRKLHNAELHALYSSPNIISLKSRRLRWIGHVACMELSRNVYRILVGNPEEVIFSENLFYWKCLKQKSPLLKEGTSLYESQCMHARWHTWIV